MLANAIATNFLLFSLNLKSVRRKNEIFLVIFKLKVNKFVAKEDGRPNKSHLITTFLNLEWQDLRGESALILT